MSTERVFRILWGPTLETALDFAYPVVGSSPTVWRQPRTGSELVKAGASQDALITGRYFYLQVTAQYFAGPQNFGGTGLQAFLDWARAGNSFTLVPNSNLPALTVSGCFLETPFQQPSIGLENDATQTVTLLIRHPTQDLGLAWRGLWFEWVAGQSLSDPVAFTYNRSAIAYEIAPQGYLLQHPADNVCDGHYPDRVGGLQTTLVGMAATNDISNPEDLTNASWTKAEFTVTANNTKAPDQNVTADLLVESVTASAFHSCIITTAVTIAAGDAITALGFFRNGGRHRGTFRVSNVANDHIVGVDYNLNAGTVTPFTAGAGAVLTDSLITPLAGGWFCIWFRGVLDGASTSYLLKVFTQDASGNNQYTGDGSSGVYFWGATAVHGAGGAKMFAPGDYMPTTSGLDTLTAAWAPVPQSMWILIDFVEGGYARANSSGGPFVIGTDGTTPFTRFDTFANPGYRFSHQTPTVAFASTPSGVPTAGQRVQLLGNIYGDGSVDAHQVIAGGAETVGARSGAIPFSAAWSASILALIHANFCGSLHRIAIGPGTRPTVAQALLV